MASEQSVLGISIEQRSNIAEQAKADAAAVGVLNQAYAAQKTAMQETASVASQLADAQDTLLQEQVEFARQFQVAGASLKEVQGMLENYGMTAKEASAAVAGLRSEEEQAMELQNQIAKLYQTQIEEEQLVTRAIRERTQAEAEAAIQEALLQEKRASAKADSISKQEADEYKASRASMLADAKAFFDQQSALDDQREQRSLQIAKEEAAAYKASRASMLADAKVAFEGIAQEEFTDAEAAKIVAEAHARVTQAYAEETQQVKLLEQGIGQSEVAQNSSAGSSRAARIAIAALTAEMALATLAAGEQLPQGLREAAKGLQTTVDLAISGGLVFEVWGAAIGAAAGLVVSLSTALNGVDPNLAELNKQLDTLASKNDAADALTKLLGVTKDEADTMLAAAKINHDYAVKLQEVADAAQVVNPLLAATDTLMKDLSTTGKGLSDFFGELGHNLQQEVVLMESGIAGLAGFLGALKDGENVVDAFASGQKQAADVIRSFLEAQAPVIPNQTKVNALVQEGAGIMDEASGKAEKFAKAQQDLADALANTDQKLNQLNQKTASEYAAAWQRYLDASANAVRTYGETVARAQTQLADRVSDIQTQLGDKTTDAWKTQADRAVDIAQQEADRVSDIQIALANKLADIQTNLALQEAALQHSYQNQLEQANQQIIQQQQQTSDKLYDIERNRIESIEALGFNTHLALESAKTQHDRAQILERTQFETAQINQKANDQSNDAVRGLNEAEMASKKKEQLALQEFNYQRALDEQKAQLDAQRAQRDAAVQIAQAQRTAAEQEALAIRTAQEQIAQAQRTAQEQTDAARRAFSEQVTQAHQAEQDKLADAQRALTARNAAIAQSYALERAQIEETRIKAYEAYIQELQLIGEVALAYQLMLQNLNDNYTALGKRLFNSGIEDFTPLPKSVTSGGGSTPPPPAGGQGIQGGIHIHVNGAGDPTKVAKEVHRVLGSALAGAAMRYSGGNG